jgi:hypothetical protein
VCHHLMDAQLHGFPQSLPSPALREDQGVEAAWSLPAGCSKDGKQGTEAAENEAFPGLCCILVPPSKLAEIWGEAQGSRDASMDATMRGGTSVTHVS